MPIIPKKKVEENYDDDDFEEDEDMEDDDDSILTPKVVSKSKTKSVIEDREMEEIKKEVKRNTQRQESREEPREMLKEEPQVIQVPRVVSSEEMLNLIYDNQLQLLNLLNLLTKKND